MPLARLGSAWTPLVLRAFRELGAEALPSPGPSLATYLDEVVAWNEKTNLTAARTPEELVDLTVADAAVLARSSDDDEAWVDVGSGAGAPGLVLPLLLPRIRMTLVEPRERRVAFLRSTIGKLGLSQIKVERGRSDRLADRSWDVAVSRATLPPPEWLREGTRLARNAVWVLLAKDDAPFVPGWSADLDIAYEWPLTGAARRAVRYRPEGA